VHSQVKHIVQAFLILLLLPIGYLFFTRLIYPGNSPQKDISFISETGKSVSSRELKEAESAGKSLFNSKCAPCHRILGEFQLYGFEQRGSWGDRVNVYEFIRDPEAFMQKDNYSRKLKEAFGSTMPAFSGLTNAEIDAIISYINYVGELRGS